MFVLEDTLVNPRFHSLCKAPYFPPYTKFPCSLILLNHINSLPIATSFRHTSKESRNKAVRNVSHFRRIRPVLVPTATFALFLSLLPHSPSSCPYCHIRPLLVPTATFTLFLSLLPHSPSSWPYCHIRPVLVPTATFVNTSHTPIIFPHIFRFLSVF
jgi:hypothetical protein